MARRPSVAIIGCGRVGGAVGLALKAAGYPIHAAWSHSRAGRQRANRLLDAPVLSSAAEVAAAADLVIVSVPDDALPDVACDVAGGIRARGHVAHTSGAVSVEVLATAREAGARVGGMHPLQTIPEPRRGAEALRGAGVAITCDPRDRAFYFRIARAWGGRPFDLTDEARTRYHAAAVFASNYLVTAAWAATVLMQGAGVADPRPLLAPLMETTLGNLVAHGPDRAITGPVARGDVAVVRRHTEELRRLGDADRRILEAYGAMARLTAHLVGADDEAIEEATS